VLPNQGTRDQVIVHWPHTASGHFECENFGPLPFPHPAMISVVPSDPAGPALTYAQQLAAALRAALLRMSPAVQGSICGGPGPTMCRGHQQAASTCILAFVGDGGRLSDYSGAVALWASRAGTDSRYRIVTVCPPAGRSAVLNALPPVFRLRNAFEWKRTPMEAVPFVLGAADLIYKDYRVFISYRQEDGQAHADDLFSALSYAGFDVFLDRVRIGVGSSIPETIREELAHKSVILVLETPLVGNSAWVAREVALAIRNRLGICALHFPHSVKVKSISDRRRQFLQLTDLDSMTGKLTPQTIAAICERVADLHTFWLLRRKYQMQRALSNAFLRGGLTNHRLTNNGCLDVVPQWRAPTVCSIKASPRMPGIEDFRELDNSAALPARWHRAIVSPGTSGFGERQVNIKWLANALMIGLFDESEIGRISTILSDPSASALK
jgi:hypothetical protein